MPIRPANPRNSKFVNGSCESLHRRSCQWRDMGSIAGMSWRTGAKSKCLGCAAFFARSSLNTGTFVRFFCRPARPDLWKRTQHARQLTDGVAFGSARRNVASMILPAIEVRGDHAVEQFTTLLRSARGLQETSDKSDPLGAIAASPRSG